MLANCLCCSSQMFAGDSLPAQVCHQCIQQVNSSYNFKLQCESSDIALRQYLRSLDSQSNSYQVIDRHKYKSELIIQDELRVVFIIIIIIIIITSSLSPLFRVATHTFLRQTMSLGDTLLQLFSLCCLWCLYV